MCWERISLVRLATMFKMSSLNCSENLDQKISSKVFLFKPTTHKPVFSGSVQRICSCQVLYHGLDHQLEEEPGAVGDVLPRVVPRQGELQGQLLVDQLPKTCASKCCKCSKISAWYNFSFFWHFIFRLHPIRVHIAIPTMAIM